ncbi:RWP-RK domain transcription factor [Volvox carteri f. nagariensis]|uniref:RWP-RK domain transcription factor n=1 Tax=Volvox carteri f. nagariensis TaxID=3068 RepID=D8TTY4_VOLCA|nr:RWP-RK domain transcription factor [Volvox carteri f. nagariensis]EFJ48946.1 RWP-RK domain transcription factor [Volvox carteri f. nagariensis]|eukprot:XP_002949843.1 RWP-RK domain transcription factor [Volvox carteri f. nagariensis]
MALSKSTAQLKGSNICSRRRMQLPYELFPQHAEAKQAGFSPRTVEAVHVVQPSEDQSFPAAAAANQAPGGGWVPPYIAGAREASGASSHASRRGPQRPCEPKAQKLHLGGGGGSVEGSWEHVDAQRYDERDVVKVEESLPYKDEVDWTEQGALHRLGLAAQVAVPWRQRRRLAVWREQESLMQQLLLHARPVAERGRASGSGGPPATSAAIPSSIPPQNQSACDTTLRQSYRCRKPLVEPEVASQTDAAGSFEGALSLSPTSPRGPANSDLPWGSVMAPKANLGDGTGTSPATVRPRLPVQRKPLQPPQRLQPPPQTWRPPGLSELPQPHPHYQQAQCGLQKRQHQQPHQGNGFVLSRSVLSSLLLAGAAAARRQRGNAALVYGSGSYPPAHKDFREEVVPTGLSAVRQLTASYGDGVDDRESEEVAAIRKAEAAGSISAAVSARGEYDSVKYDSAAAAAPSSGAAAGVAPAASRQPTDVGHRGATLAAAAAAAGGCGGGDGGGVYINTSGDCHGRTGTTTVGQSVAPPTEGHGRMAVQEKYGYGSDDVQCVITYEKPDKVPGHARMLKLLQQQQQQQQQHDLMVTRREMQKNRHYELASYITDLGCDDGTGLPGGAAREAQRQSLAGGSLIAVSRQHGATATTTVRATAIAHIAIGQQTQTEAVQKTSAESGGKPLLPPPAMVAAAAKVAAASSLRQPYIHLKATTPATPHHANAAAIRGTSGSITTGARRSESVGASPAPTIVRETGTGGLLSGPGAAATVAEGSPRAAQASPEASFRICPAENDSPFAAREAAVIATAAVAPATAVRNGPRQISPVAAALLPPQSPPQASAWRSGLKASHAILSQSGSASAVGCLARRRRRLHKGCRPTPPRAYGNRRICTRIWHLAAGSRQKSSSGLALDLDSGLALDLDSGLALDLDSGLALDLDSGLALDLDSGLALNLDSGLDLNLDSGLDLNLDSGLDLDLDAPSSMPISRSSRSKWRRNRNLVAYGQISSSFKFKFQNSVTDSHNENSASYGTRTTSSSSSSVHKLLTAGPHCEQTAGRDAVGFDRMDAIMGPGQPEPPATGSRLHSNVTGQIDIPGQQQQQEDHHYHHYHHQQQHQQQPKQQQEKQRQGEVQEFARQRLRAALRGTPPSSQPVLSGAYPDCSGIGPDAGVAGAGVGTEPPFGRSADGEQQLGTHVRWGASSGGAAAGPWDAAEPRLERSSRKQRRQEDTEPRVEEEEEEQRRRRKPWQHQHQPQEQHRGLLQRGQPQLQRALGDPEEQPLQQQQPAHHHRNRYHHNHHRHHLPLGFKDDVRSEAMAAPTWSAARPGVGPSFAAGGVDATAGRGSGVGGDAGNSTAAAAGKGSAGAAAAVEVGAGSAVQRGAGGDIRLEDLRKTFNMPAPQAAMALGTSTTNLKRKCRQLGILRWPHRKLDSLNRLRSLVLSDVVEKSQRQAFLIMKYYRVTPSAISTIRVGMQALLDSIARNIQQIHQDPNSGLVPSLKNLRQAYYKRGFDVRARRGGSLVAGTTDSDNCSA